MGDSENVSKEFQLSCLEDALYRGCVGSGEYLLVGDCGVEGSSTFV